jgi:hypothetical protein
VVIEILFRARVLSIAMPAASVKKRARASCGSVGSRPLQPFFCLVGSVVLPSSFLIALSASAGFVAHGFMYISAFHSAPAVRSSA